jgi:hypothetical protein
MLLFAGLAALVVGLAGCGATAAWGAANSTPQGSMMGGGMMGGGMMGGGMMGGGMMGSSMMAGMAQPMMVWRPGAGPVSSPQDAAPTALSAVRGRGWDWLTLDEVHIFPMFYEVEFNDRAGFKGPEVYVDRSSGNVGPEMGPNMMWDSQYGMMGAACATARAESDARALAARATSSALGDGEQHHGYWEFELKTGGAVVNQINVQDCTGAVINEQMWQPDMQGTYAPSG